MARTKTPSFIVTRRMEPQPYIKDRIDRDMDTSNRMYNRGVKHVRPIIDAIKELPEYQADLAHLRECNDKKEGKVYAQTIGELMKEYGLTEYALHAWYKDLRNRSYQKALNIDIVQKTASALYQSVKKAVFSGTKIHYRKRGRTDCLEGKKAGSAIIFDPDTDSIKYHGMSIRLKPIRKGDTYLREAMAHKIKYCKIKREPYKAGYRYFLQLVMEGEPPQKAKRGSGKAGIDPGVSTMSVVTDHAAKQYILGNDIKTYEKEIYEQSTRAQRRLRMANPNNYDPDGTVKRGKKRWIRTKGYREAVMRLKSAYAKKSRVLQQSHGRQTNEIIRMCDTILIEPIDYKALAKRAKETKRQATASAVKKKNGKVIQVCKYKRKKRFGTSIGRRAPAAFISKLKEKCARYGLDVFEIDTTAVKASQYDHTTGNCKKPALGERTKMIGGHRVQRDLYSGFLIKHVGPDGTTIDQGACKKEFSDFLIAQEQCIDEVKKTGDLTKNFGLKDFLAEQKTADETAA